MTTTVSARDGRTIAYHDYNPGGGIAALWCHGGPGSRFEPQPYADAAGERHIRLIGIDRPGYGESTPLPGRLIGDWPADALAVADALELTQFIMIGVSTGGAYALATAARAPERVKGVVTCCAMTDMGWAGTHAPMAPNERIWSSTSRAEAMDIVIEDFGEDGSKMFDGEDVGEMLAPADLALLADPHFAANFDNGEAFKQGVVGYADDRLADAPSNGWASFDINDVSCAVLVMHGEADGIVPPAHSRHTAEIVPNANLRLLADHGHLSVISEIVPALIDFHEQS